ncbi:MAG: flagellar hook-associated protein 3 [Brevinematales bacterium]|nr:flagellar hook-associated protein 3 [Brevinematales bacterium]
MLGRVTQGYMQQDFDYHLHKRQTETQSVERQLASGMRVNLPSDDPVATINFMDYDSRLKEMSVYRSQISFAQSKLKTIDSSLDTVTQILQRLRELAVQAANGVYTKEEREKIAVEVDQLTREILSQANSYYKGEALFGGTMVFDTPFKAQYQINQQTGIEFLEDVRYIGNSQAQLLEVERSIKITMSQPGNQIFWAQDMGIYSTLSVSGYTAPKDSKIVIDGHEIQIRAGDNIETIANKINGAGLAVRASIQTQAGSSFFSIESTSPHQIVMYDMEGGSVLQDLGLVDNGMYPPYNYSPSARVYTGSIFDVLIDFRKALLNDNIHQIGGTALAGIDQSLENLLRYRANLGSVSSRLDIINERFLADEVYITEAKDNAVATDIPRTITKLKMLEFSHDVALNIGARILPKTLLDFLR